MNTDWIWEGGKMKKKFLMGYGWFLPSKCAVLLLFHYFYIKSFCLQKSFSQSFLCFYAAHIHFCLVND